MSGSRASGGRQQRESHGVYVRFSWTEVAICAASAPGPPLASAGESQCGRKMTVVREERKVRIPACFG